MSDELGKVATSAIDALKASPALLVLVMMQAATLGLIYFTVEASSARWQERQMALIDRCFPLSKGDYSTWLTQN